VRAVSVVAYCEGVGWDKTELETERTFWDKNVPGKGSRQVNYRALNLVFSQAVRRFDLGREDLDK
jgi:hypothetical protein